GDADRDCMAVFDERRNRGRELGRIRRERGQKAEHRLRQSESQADVVEAARKDRRGSEHDADRDQEDRYGGCGRHWLTPTSLPGTPLRTLAQVVAQAPGSGGGSSASISASAASAAAGVPGMPGPTPPPL